MCTAVRRTLLGAVVAVVLACAAVGCVGAAQAQPEPVSVGALRCGYDELRARTTDTGVSVVSSLEPPASERTVAAAASASDPWHPIRIAVFTEDISNGSQHCTYAGQERPTFDGKTARCNRYDVLTNAKKRTLLELLIPSAIKLHRERLSVQRKSGNIVVARGVKKNRICGDFSIPASHMTTGVPDADFVLYIAAGPTSPSFVAWAAACQIFRNGRPAVGVANVSPRHIAATTKIVRVVAHELLHALGFGVTFFEAKKMISFVNLRGKSDAPVISTPNVAAQAEAHYGCSTSAFMELEDVGGVATGRSHWKRRNAKDDLMAGFMGAGIYSAITIAAMEDLGYYKGNYSNAEPMTYGRNAGCGLTTSKCVINGVSQFPEMFCDLKVNRRMCVSDRSGLGECLLLLYPKGVPAHFQYFNNSTVGGSDSMMDYCPEVETTHIGECSDTAQRLPGSVHGSSSRCLDTPNGFSMGPKQHSQHGICADVECGPTVYAIRIKGASVFTVCLPGSVLQLKWMSPLFTRGTLTCPPYDSLCAIKKDDAPYSKYAALIADQSNAVL